MHRTNTTILILFILSAYGLERVRRPDRLSCPSAHSQHTIFVYIRIVTRTFADDISDADICHQGGFIPLAFDPIALRPIRALMKAALGGDHHVCRDWYTIGNGKVRSGTAGDPFVGSFSPPKSRTRIKGMAGIVQCPQLLDRAVPILDPAPRYRCRLGRSPIL